MAAGHLHRSQKGPFGSQFSQVLQILHALKLGPKMDDFFETFVWGACGPGRACLSLQILQSMVRNSIRARFPLEGCGELHGLRPLPMAPDNSLLF